MNKLDLQQNVGSNFSFIKTTVSSISKCSKQHPSWAMMKIFIALLNSGVLFKMSMKGIMTCCILIM